MFRPGGPIALVTNRCLFDFDRARRRFRLASVHPGHSVAEVIENTGFDFDRPAEVPVTEAPTAETLQMMRSVVAPMLAEVYPQFAEKVFGVEFDPVILSWPRSGSRRMRPKRLGRRPSRLATLAPQGDG